MSDSGKPSIAGKVIAETTKFILIVGYVWVILLLLHLHKFAILRELHRTYRLDYRIGLALITALVVGKVILLADDLHVAELKAKRLVYSILFRSAVFAVIVVLFDVLEEVAVGMLRGRTFAESVPQMGGGGLEGKLIAGTIVFVALIPFIVFTELRRVLGARALRSLMLAKRAPEKAA